MKKIIKYPIFLVLLSGLLMYSFTSTQKIISQKIERHVIMFKIVGQLDYYKAQSIDAQISTYDGVLASRTNPDNNIYFSYTLKSKNVSESDFKAWFKKLGYEITCFDKVVEGEEASKSYEEFEKC